MFLRKPRRAPGAAIAFVGMLLGASFASAQNGVAVLTPGTMHNFAGGANPTTGNGDGGAATSASLKGPNAVAVDAAGNVYIAETSAFRVRKVTTAGIISTFAGTGSAGTGGNNGQAAAATLSGPSGLTFDAAGNLYIIDKAANQIRKVDTSGVITLFAGTGAATSTGDGGQAASATLNGPGAMAIDSAGNFYILETNGNRVRKVDTSGVISAFAGTGTASYSGDNGQATLATFNSPRGIAVDAAGNVFIADYVNSRIRKIAVGGIVTTFAGTGSAGFSGDGGLATAAKINAPRAVAFDAAGNLYITDGLNNRIRVVGLDKNINTVAGGATACATKSDAYGDTCPATQALLSLPLHMALDAAGNLYIVDFNNNLIRRDVVNATAVVFPDQFSGVASSNQIVTLSNNGAGSLQLTGLAITGSAFTQGTSGGTDCTSTTALASGASCQIAIVFTPTSVTNFTGSITVTDNSQGVITSTQTIALSGAGILPAPTVTLSINPTTAGPGQTVTFTATVAGAGSANPSGTVQFLNGTTVIGAATLNSSGVGTFTDAELLPGSYSVKASYLGDSSYAVATSTPAVALTVNSGAATNIAVTATPVILTPGQSSLLKVTVTPVTGSVQPTGTVMFFDGTTQIGAVQTLVAGQAQITTSAFNYGANSITALYSGDATFSAEYSPVTMVTVGSLPLATVTPGVLSTFAGTGTTGFSGEGVAATSAKVNQPIRTAMDGAGNIYFADLGNHVVRKITPAGIVSTFAGTPQMSGYSGDGGQATAALLNGPRGVAVDATGNVYILDGGNSIIRKVDTAGVITRFAGVQTTGVPTSSGNGGPALSANLNTPRGLAVDLQGNVYIAENANNQVRKVDASGIITAFAGTGSSGLTGNNGAATAATLNAPYGVSVDKAGNVYIADTGNDAIRKVNTAGIITSISGNGTSNYTGDGGLATAATLSIPREAAVDGGGNIYIADTGNAVIRKVNGAGIISTIAGTHVAGDTGDGGAATAGELNSIYGIMLDANDNLILGDIVANVLRKITVSSGAMAFAPQLLNTASAAQTATISNAGGQALTLASVAISGAGYSTAASGGVDCAASTVLAPGASCLIAVKFTPGTLGALPGQIVITDNSNGVSGTQQTVAITGVGTLTATTATLTVTPAMSNKGTLETFTSTVTITTPPGPGGSPTGSVSFMNGTDVIGTAPLVGNTATFTSSTLGRGTYSVTAVYSGDTTFNPATSPASPLVINGASSATTLMSASNTIAQGSGLLLTGTVSVASGVATGMVSFYNGTTLLGTGNLNGTGVATFTASFIQTGMQSITASYNGDPNFNTSVSAPMQITVTAGPIAVLTPGIISTIAGTGSTGFGGDNGPAVGATISAPSGGMVFDSSGNLYFSDTGNNRVRMITPAGVISTVAGTGTGGYSGDGGQATLAHINIPRQLAMDAAGNLYIADLGNSRIRKVTPAGVISTVAGSGVVGFSGDNGAATSAQMTAASGVAVDGNGNIFISDAGIQRLRKVDASGIITTIAGTGIAGFSGDGGASTGAAVSTPGNLVVDAAGNVFFSDVNNSRIRKISTTGIITTVVGKGVAGYVGDGGFATAAETNGVVSLAVDAAGDLYLADSKNSVVRKVDGDGYISTIAGSNVSGNSGDGGVATKATLATTNSIAVDATGNVYFIDPTSEVMRKVTTANSVLNMGTVPFNTTGATTVTLSNAGAQPLSLASFTASGAGFSVAPAATRGCVAAGMLAAGSSCMLTVTFAPTTLGPYTGTVTFTDNSLNAAGATQQFSLTGVGGKLPPSIVVTSTPAAFILPGGSVTFTAKVTSSVAPNTIASGSISFMNGSTLLGTVALDGTGNASLPAANLPSGGYSITAVYTGDANYLAGTSAPLLFGVQNDFTVALSSTTGTVSAGGTVTTQLTITPAGLLPGVVSATCVGPGYLVCTFTPATQPASSTPITMQMTITSTPPPVGIGMSLQMLFGTSTLLLLFRKRRWISRGLVMVVLLAGLGAVTGCGSGTFEPSPAPIAVTVIVTSGQASHSIVYNVTVR